MSSATTQGDKTIRGKRIQPDTSHKTPKSAVSPARLSAYTVLEIVRKRSAFSAEVMRESKEFAELSEQDRSFAQLLVRGVVSHQGALDALINQSVAHPKDIRPNLRTALRISAFELFYLKKESYASVNQGVELVKAVIPKASRFANYVLRRLSEQASQFSLETTPTSLATAEIQYAFPHWLAHTLATDLSFPEAIHFMEASNHPAPLYLAANPLKTTTEELQTTLAGANIESHIVASIPGCVKVVKPNALRSTVLQNALAAHLCVVADASSQQVAWMSLPSKKPHAMLEVCCGRGTKTLLLQFGAYRKYGALIPLLSLDNLAYKCEITLKRCADFKLPCVYVVPADATNQEALCAHIKNFSMFATKCDETDHKVAPLTHFSLDNLSIFDACLIDAPCSGIGTLRRHPEIRWRISLDDVREQSAIAQNILTTCSAFVAPEGMLTFATCSPLKAEDEGVIGSFLETNASYSLQTDSIGQPILYRPRLISDGPDAHFAACVIRTGA